MSEAPDVTPMPSNTRTIFGFKIDVDQVAPAVMGTVAGAIVTGLFAFALAWWNANAPHLKWTSSGVISFQGEKYKFGIVSVSVINDGSKEAKTVQCRLSLGGPTIQEAKVTPEILDPKVTFKGDTVNVAIDTLNDGESFQLSVVTTDTRPVSNRLIPEVRAIGIIGENAANVDRLSSIISNIFAASFGVLVAIAATWSTRILNRRARETLILAQAKLTQVEALAKEQKSK